MRNRARVLPFVIVSLVVGACGQPPSADSNERTGSGASSAQGTLYAASCDSQPWAGDGSHSCGSPSLTTEPMTCADLGLAPGGTNAVVDQLTPDAQGFIRSNVALDDGFVMTVYTNNGKSPYDWAITENVKADGSTRTVDAIIFSGAASDGSLVYRFDPPEFYVHNMSEQFPVTNVQLCGIRPGHAASLPPPPPDQKFTLSCASSTGGSIPPGPTFPNEKAIDYDVTVSPAPPDGSVVAVEGILGGGSGSRGTAFYQTTGGHIVGSDYAQYLAGVTGPVELRFTFSGGSCSLYWTLGESGSNGHTW